ncbi:MAG: nucleotidyltransferase substrate binding protein [Gammaproteobacteria bacterium]|nr:nucleotidyltransferase substrate binding protein [Gammaproteobacteria bacterium]
MERLKERISQTEKALNSFNEILNISYSKIVRDAAIQRFEFTLETIWKLAQRYILLQSGIDAGSPKAVIRGCFQAGLINEEQTETLLTAIDDRNLTAHTYNEKLAEMIYKNLFKYQPIFSSLFQKISIDFNNIS